MNKEYLKMADVFPSEMRVGGDSDNLIIDDVGIIIGCYSGDKMAEHVLHAINSHDELVAEVERLREHLKLCATELSAMIDRHNVHNIEDDSWLYDHQTPWEAMQILK